ncbi:inositol monophosphatase family protein [Streptomyces sp. NPDC001834]|uniref:inositol monophosphatase family protein n=1 Tax=Streptomyces sp. NPDC001834 TaxID=3364616 RepID=UPI0036893423
MLAEEGGATSGLSGPRWIIDPLSGTEYFTDRVPLFSNDLAHEDEHGPAIGVIDMPMSRRMIVAGRGLGCRVLPGPEPDLRSGRRAQVTKRTGGAAGPSGPPPRIVVRGSLRPRTGVTE